MRQLQEKYREKKREIKTSENLTDQVISLHYGASSREKAMADLSGELEIEVVNQG